MLGNGEKSRATTHEDRSGLSFPQNRVVGRIPRGLRLTDHIAALVNAAGEAVSSPQGAEIGYRAVFPEESVAGRIPRGLRLTDHIAAARINYNQGSPLHTIGARQTLGGQVWNLVGNWTGLLSSSTYNEARASFMSNKPPILCNQADAGGHTLLELGPPGTFSRKAYPGAMFGCGFTGLEAEQDLTLMDTFSFIHGRHQVKFGGQAMQVRTITDSLSERNGNWSFLHDVVFDIDNPLSYPDRWSGGLTVPRYNEPAWSTGLFVQDSWTVRDDVTLNLGVRYEIDRSITIVNTFIDAKNARIVQLAGGDPPYHTQSADKNNIAPRFGIVWRPGSSNRMTVRGRQASSTT